MKITYTSKDYREIKKANQALEVIEKFKKRSFLGKIFYGISFLIARHQLSTLEKEYFKPRMSRLMHQFGITNLSYGTYHFKTFQTFVADQEKILPNLPDEVLDALK